MKKYLFFAVLFLASSALAGSFGGGRSSGGFSSSRSYSSGFNGSRSISVPSRSYSSGSSFGGYRSATTTTGRAASITRPAAPAPVYRYSGGGTVASNVYVHNYNSGPGFFTQLLWWQMMSQPHVMVGADGIAVPYTYVTPWWVYLFWFLVIVGIFFIFIWASEF